MFLDCHSSCCALEPIQTSAHDISAQDLAPTFYQAHQVFACICPSDSHVFMFLLSCFCAVVLV